MSVNLSARSLLDPALVGRLLSETGFAAHPAYAEVAVERPVFVVEKAVKGMLPKNRLGRAMIKKLHVVEGAEHRHQAQQPVAYTLGQPPAWEGLPVPAAPRPAKPATVSPPYAAR